MTYFWLYFQGLLDPQLCASPSLSPSLARSLSLSLALSRSLSLSLCLAHSVYENEILVYTYLWFYVFNLYIIFDSLILPPGLLFVESCRMAEGPAFVNDHAWQGGSRPRESQLTCFFIFKSLV